MLAPNTELQRASPSQDIFSEQVTSTGYNAQISLSFCALSKHLSIFSSKHRANFNFGWITGQELPGWRWWR